MAYGLKYENLCATRINRDLFILRLSVDGYASGIVDRDIPVNPFVLNKERASYIRGTSLDFQIREVVDFEFLAFYTNNPKYIKAELFRNIITSFTNVSYETFTGTARTITSAIETGSAGVCVSNDFTLKAGEKLRIKFTLTKTSGQTPVIGITDGANDYNTTLAEGANDVELTAVVGGTYHIYFSNSAAANWHTGDVWGMRPRWSGWVNPQQYSVPYITSPVNVKFTATDGLGLLKQENFTLTGNNSELTIIRHCVDKIALSLRYAIAIDVIEVNQDDTRSVLAQTFRNCDEFEDMDCYEVLEKILINYDAEISQCHNRWQIIRSTCKKLTRMLYTTAGVYDTTEAAPTPLDLGSVLGSGTEVRPAGNLWLDLEPGGKSVKVTHNYGRKLSYLDNYDFKHYASSAFTGWTKNGSFTPTQGFIDGVFYAYLGSSSNVDTDYIEQSKSVTKVADEPFVFEINVCTVGRTISAYVGAVAVSMDVRMQVTLEVGATTYYLGATGWTTTPGYITHTIGSVIYTSLIEWTPIKYITSELIGDGTLKVRLQRYKSAGPGSGTSYGGIAFSDVKAYPLETDGDLYPEKTELTYSFDNSSEPNKLSEIELTSADAPAVENNELLYSKITRLTAAGTPTLQWLIGSTDTVLTIIQMLVKTLASNNRVARQKLTGEIRGSADIAFDDIIKHTYNSSREFEIAEAAWDIYEEKMQVTLLEVLAWSDEAVTADDGSTIEGAANLTVASVTLSENPVIPEKVFTATVHVDNSGDSAGRRNIEWELRTKIGNTVVDSGTQMTALIAASADANVAISITSAVDPATYYVAARIITDTSWVLSADLVVAAADIEVNSLASVANGAASQPMTVSLNISNTGGADTYNVTYACYDSIDSLIYSGDEDIIVANGTSDYELSEPDYPATPGTGYYIVVAGITSNAFNVSA